MRIRYSIIIPTLNEERNISKVISQFKPFKKYSCEVIVSDGDSKDKTMKIAKDLGAKVIRNKECRITAYNRNRGAEVAKADILIFCDADTMIKDVNLFFKRISTILRDESIVGGMPRISVFPEETMLKDRIYHAFYNNIIRISFFLGINFSSGQCQIVRRSAFFKVKGYCEDRVHGEDSDLFFRLGKIGKLHYFSDLCVYESPRRYRKIGYLKVILLGIASILNQILFKKSIIKEWKRVD